MTIGIFASGIIATFINAYPNLTLLDYSFKEQLKDIIPCLLISLVMGGAVYPIKWFEMSDMLTVIFQIGTGILIYIVLAIAFKLECFTYLLNTIKEMFGRKKGTVIKGIF